MLPWVRVQNFASRLAADWQARFAVEPTLTVETLSRYTGAEIGKRQVEELVGRAAQDFDAFYAQRHHQAAAAQAASEPPAATGAEPAAGLLVITSDAKGVVMHREDLRPATRTASVLTSTAGGVYIDVGQLAATRGSSSV